MTLTEAIFWMFVTAAGGLLAAIMLRCSPAIVARGKKTWSKWQDHSRERRTAKRALRLHGRIAEHSIDLYELDRNTPESASYLAQALTHADRANWEQTRPGRLATVLLALGRLERLKGTECSWDDAEDHLKRCIRIAPTPLFEIEARQELKRIYRDTGKWRQVVEECEIIEILALKVGRPSLLPKVIQSSKSALFAGASETRDRLERLAQSCDNALAICRARGDQTAEILVYQEYAGILGTLANGDVDVDHSYPLKSLGQAENLCKRLSKLHRPNDQLQCCIAIARFYSSAFQWLKASEILKKACELCDSHDLIDDKITVLELRASALSKCGEPGLAQAIDSSEDALASARRRNDRGRVRSVLGRLGRLYCRQAGEDALGAARRAHEEHKKLAKDVRDPGGEAWALNGLAEVELAQQSWCRALALARSAEQGFQQKNETANVALARVNAGSALLGQGRYGAAWNEAEKASCALNKRPHTTPLWLRGVVLLLKARTRHAQGNQQEAREFLSKALLIFERTSYQTGIEEAKRIEGDFNAGV